VISTNQLATRLKMRDVGARAFWLIDARGCTTEPTIPTSICLNPDTIGALETQVPDKSTEIVAFCHDGACPMSYQMASQALAAGYTDVVWYRGGANAWIAAGGPTIVRGPVTQ
jgi:rhodanese-related sulfurtransferase